MKALELSRAYFDEIAFPRLALAFPELINKLAAGLCGNGSECFGYDDELSRDHDWGVDFFIWLSDDAQSALDGVREFKQTLFSQKPPQFIRKKSFYGAGIGVMTTGEFYRSLIGKNNAPEALGEWVRIPEENLALATNGEVFYDGAGEFSSVRSKLKGYFPEDLRRKRLSSRCMAMAQTGQYNLERTVKRGDYATAAVIIGKFIEAAAASVFLLNKRFRPYYKWVIRSLGEQPIIGKECARLLSELASLRDFSSGYINAARDIIENVCALIADELRRQGLCATKESFLTECGEELRAGISEPSIRALPAQYEL